MSDGPITNSEYYEECNRIAKDAVAETLDDDGRPDRDAASDRVWEEVDGHAWIIWTSRNLEVLGITRNGDAAEEMGGLDGILKDKGISGLHAVLAFCAMRRDVEEYLDQEIDAANDAADAREELHKGIALRGLMIRDALFPYPEGVEAPE